MQHACPPAPPTSSQLYRRAAGIKAQGSPAAKACTCIMCTARLQVGDLVNPITENLFGKSFNNKLDIHAPGDVVCGDCMALWSGKFLQKYSKSVASEEGVYGLSKNVDIQAFILTPPKPPFVAVFNTRQQQHMIWRTPVCLSQDVLLVRIDDDILHVRRELALHAVGAWQRTLVVMKKLGLRGQPSIPNRTLSSRHMGWMRDDVAQRVAEHSEHGAQDIATLQSLRMGEWWVLSVMAELKLDAPETWPALTRLLPAQA